MALEDETVSNMYKLAMSQRQGQLEDCEDLLSRNPVVMRQLEDAKFSAVVYDQFYMCSLLLAMKLNASAVMSNPMSATAAFSSLTRNPVNLALVPASMFGFTNRMTFFQVGVKVIKLTIMNIANKQTKIKQCLQYFV